MQSVQPPEQVQAAFDDAVKAGQDRERQKNEGQAYANDVIPKARGTAARLMEEANGYRSRIISTAEGDASRFSQVLTEYNKAPEVTRSRMYLETLQQIYSSTSKVMIDAKGQWQPAVPAARQADAGRAGPVAAAAASGRPCPSGCYPVNCPRMQPKTERSQAAGENRAFSLRLARAGRTLMRAHICLLSLLHLWPAGAVCHDGLYRRPAAIRDHLPIG
jgi:membrane protease subunit HflK